MAKTRVDDTPKRTQYIRDVFGAEDEALASIGQELPDVERRMQIGPDEGKILNTLVRMVGAKKIVEIGSLNGYSAVWMARALPEGGKLYALELSSARAAVCQANFEKCGVADKAEVLSGDALDNLRKLEQHGPFDVVFIDADKNNYCNYLDWAEKNVRKGGLIIGDNTFMFGGVYGDMSRGQKPENVEIMNDFNKRLANPEKYSSVMIPTAEGLTVALKES